MFSSLDHGFNTDSQWGLTSTLHGTGLFGYHFSGLFFRSIDLQLALFFGLVNWKLFPRIEQCLRIWSNGYYTIITCDNPCMCWSFCLFNHSIYICSRKCRVGGEHKRYNASLQRWLITMFSFYVRTLHIYIYIYTYCFLLIFVDRSSITSDCA